METSEESAEEVVQRDDKSVSPLFAVVEFECWVLLWALGERERCVRCGEGVVCIVECSVGYIIM